MPTTAKYLHVTETTITCSRLDDLTDDVAAALLDWLHQHSLDEHQILASTPIVRDPGARTLTWTSVNRHGGPAMQVIDQAPLTATDPWPAPFPQVLLDQQRPACCLACGRPLDEEGSE